MPKIYTRNLILLILIIAFHGCIKEEVNYTVLSGKIENGRELKLIAHSFANNTDISINLDDNGTFRDTIYTEEGRYQIRDGKNNIGIYLRPSKEYVFNYDVESFKQKGIELRGNDTVYNSYLTEKSQKQVFFNPTSFSEEKEIRNFLNKIKKEELDRLDQFELSRVQKDFERQSITYGYLADLLLLLTYADIKGKSDLTIQELNINYNNEEHYKTYGSYRRLISYHYANLKSHYENQELLVDTTFSIHKEAIKFYALNIQNEFIKNEIIANNALSDLQNSDDYIKVYKDYKTFYTGNDSLFNRRFLESYISLNKLNIGAESPKFFNYKNYKGGSNSLDDFLGKPIYINLWASWCGPCINKMPAFKALFEEYVDTNLVFLNIAVSDEEYKWREIIEEKELPGINLLGNNKNQSFLDEYGVNGIPRYILIDREGKIVNYNAPSPNDRELKISLNKLVN